MARAEDIRRFARRDWHRAQESKRAYWAQLSPAARFELAAGLWAQARAALPGWPDARQRREDLAHHVELARKLHAVAHAFPRR